ncbi:hypothetical protein Nepgr_003745 [Nepenthes gracilis]|uniref:UspA domain-containing protein n=1 Tax=Nepenthes gracilis TaxID=150966 RepID=A0AAD3XED7_NEPGR|nr:hypothetical protein Nepgr_003745 [Nepenthes gracilis]
MEVAAGEVETEQKKKVMVAIDETEGSYYALIWALDNLHQSLITCPLLIFMTEPPPNYNILASTLSSARLYSNVSPTQEFVNNVQEKEKKVALGLLEKAKSICTSQGIRAETLSEVGDPKVAICNAVEEHNINLLVLAEQNIGRIKGTFKWSVSDYCVQHAKCPVLVVKKPE